MWHKVKGSCGCIVFSLSDAFDPMTVYRLCFSPVENLLASLHEIPGRRKAFRLWEVNAEGLAFKVEVRLDDEVDIFGCTFSRNGRQLILICRDSTLRIHSVSDAQLIKVIPPIRDREGVFEIIGTTADGCQAVCFQYTFRSLGVSRVPRVRLWDVHGDGSTFEEVRVCQKGELVSKIAISPLDDSIAIMIRPGVIKLALRRAVDMTWTIEVVADGKRFDMSNLSFSTSGQLLATVHVEGRVEIWDPIKGKCLRMLQSTLETGIFADDGLCLYNI
jgi:WD40 repeat protein